MRPLYNLLALVNRTTHRNLSISARSEIDIIIPNDAPTRPKRALALCAIQTSIISVVRAKHLLLMNVLLVVPILRSAHI